MFFLRVNGHTFYKSFIASIARRERAFKAASLKGVNVMRVVHVNYDGEKDGGASIAMFRIIEAQREVGIDVAVACRCRPVESQTYQYVPSLFYRGVEFLSKVAMKLRYGRCFSTGLIDNGMADFVNSLQPDIVQLNWLQANTMGVKELTKIKCPIVWFTHDLWPMSGVEPYPAEEWFKKGPPDDFWLNKKVWGRKREVVKRLKGRLYVVSPSEWACKQARDSIVFKDIACTCIHYPANKILVKACEDFNGKTKIHNDRFTILFGATTGISAPIKGWDRLMSAIDLLTDEERQLMKIRVFGCETPSQKMHGVDVEFLGRLTIEELIPEYRRADLFAFPSRQETWGQTKTEALCCGTPVIAFDQTACANGIRHQKNGWIAPADNIGAYADGIRWFLKRWHENAPLDIRGEVDIYRPDAVAVEWKSFYESILDRRKG